MHFDIKNKKFLFIGILCTVVIAAVIIAVVLVVITKSNQDVPEMLNSREETISNQLFINDLYNGGMYIPKYDIGVNAYDNEQFTETNGRITYGEGEVAAGIDVSDHQNDIDWARVKASGIDFAIIRVGYRGFTEGKIMADERFAQNIAGATDNDIAVGVYFFSQATSEAEAEAEAQYVLDQIADYTITYPVVFDWEPITSYAEGATPRTSLTTEEEVSRFAAVFCKKVKDAGYKPCFYTNKNMGYGTFDLGLLNEYDMWLAEYQKIPSFYYHFDIWQYTSEGTVDGISTSVDMNISFKKYS